MTPAYMLCRGRTIVLPDLTVAEAMVEVVQLNDNPALTRNGYEVVVVEGDDILGRAGFDAAGEFGIVAPAASFAGH